MSWTIPDLLLHDKLLLVSEQRALGYTKFFVYCSNPGCHHNAVLDTSHLPDEITFNELQTRMACTVCDHRGADVRNQAEHSTTGTAARNAGARLSPTDPKSAVEPSPAGPKPVQPADRPAPDRS